MNTTPPILAADNQPNGSTIMVDLITCDPDTMRRMFDEHESAGSAEFVTVGLFAAAAQWRLANEELDAHDRSTIEGVAFSAQQWAE